VTGSLHPNQPLQSSAYPSRSLPAATTPSAGIQPDLRWPESGTSQLTIPGIAAPFYLTERYLGFVTWKLITSGGQLVVLEHVPDSWSSPPMRTSSSIASGVARSAVSIGVFDRYGGMPGTGPYYSGAIRLVPYRR